MPHTLETSRLILRPFTEADIDPAYRLFETHPDVYRFDPGHARTRDQRAAIVRRYITDNQEDGEGTLAVTLKDSGALIGQAGLQLYMLPCPPFATPEVELYYKLGRAHWGQGYAEETCRALIKFAFDRINLLRIVTITQPDNEHSIRLLKRLGFSVAPGPEAWAPAVMAVLVNPKAGAGDEEG
jgi:[ribosomal protein S5]-alanine N-acetyltransferase